MKTYTPEQHEIFRAGGAILRDTLLHLQSKLAPGISTLELDKIAEDYIRSRDAEPAFKGQSGYNHTICAAVNHEIIHGMPRATSILKNGDIISIDAGVRYGGFCTDAARTFAVGQISPDAQSLIDATRNSFFVAIDGLKAGHPISHIGSRIEDFITKNTTFSIIENFFGHGIGENVHQEPLIPNFRARKPGLREIVKQTLSAGVVLAIEPMINQGTKDNKTLNDKWTVVTSDGKLAAHYENTVIIHETHAEVITE